MRDRGSFWGTISRLFVMLMLVSTLAYLILAFSTEEVDPSEPPNPKGVRLGGAAGGYSTKKEREESRETRESF